MRAAAGLRAGSSGAAVALVGDVLAVQAVLHGAGQGVQARRQLVPASAVRAQKIPRRWEICAAWE
jgi:hypothetical protein